eukprot:TRINITY_DN82107_c0_g1_i1.p1 TRINITY_DN82107_c0_g1~~TRINITY_DN82107_c0_g1_i1.p1  ORF type:complete len:305 (-),score=106.91 TRINITY_DN82107_c0_g1_i1:169-1083(-)
MERQQRLADGRRKSKLRGMMLLSAAHQLFCLWQIMDGGLFQSSTNSTTFVPGVGGGRQTGLKPEQKRNLRTRRNGFMEDVQTALFGSEEDGLKAWGRLQGKELEDPYYPPEEQWTVDEDGTVLKWKFEGARSFWLCFWAIILPPISAGFLIVGASAGLGWQLVDLTPWTAENLPFLRSNVFIQWVPQGVFMSFYGFGGLFLLSPLIWWLVVTNKGNGVLRFDKKTELMQMVRDGELKEEVPFEEIKSVRMEWNELALSNRELLIIKQDGDEVRWWNEGDKPKETVERRGSQLANFINKELTLDE